MTSQYSADVPKGFNVPKQVRLDSITGVQNELTLKNLGAGNSLAFKYYEGLKVYCKDEKKEYIWRQVVGSETGLLTTHFVYPTYPSIDGIDYSGKSFNFFLVPNSNITPPDGSETKINAGTGIAKSGTGTTLDPYIISSNITIPPTLIIGGDNITIDGNGSLGDEYVISADLSDLGIVKTVNNAVTAPGQSLSIINNELTGKALATKEYVQSIIPATPNGSETKINAGNNITIAGNGTTATPYIVNSLDTNTTYSAGTSLNLSGTEFQRAALIGDVTALVNSNTTTIAVNAVTTEKIADFNITTAKIANNAITVTKLPTGATATTFLRGDGTWVTPIDTNTTYTAGTGISLVGTTFNNTLPDQTVGITGAGATVITGTYPNFTISSTDTNTTYSASTGLSLTGTVFSLENLQKVITNNYTLTDVDNEYTIFINNDVTAITISLGTITIPNFCVGFIQEGTADVTFTGVTNPTGLKSKGQGYQTFIERKLQTSLFYLLGNTKV